MEVLEEIIFAKGYCLVDTNNIGALRDIQEQLINLVCKHKKLQEVADIEGLREKLKSLSGNEINHVMLSLLSFTSLSSMLVEAFSDTVVKLAGEKLFLQRRSHVMFNVSGFKDNAVAPHIDGMSGVSPFTFILWTPAHEIDDESGIWLWDQERTMKCLQEESEKKTVMGDYLLSTTEKEPIRLKFGEAVIFNPFVLHGSLAHNNSLSRIGFSCRFQSQNHPLFIRNSEFYYPYHLG